MKNKPNAVGAMLLIAPFLLRLMGSPLFAAKTFLALLFQKVNAKKQIVLS